MHLPSPPARDVLRVPSADVGEGVRRKPLSLTSYLQQQEALDGAVIGIPKATTPLGLQQVCPSPGLCLPHREVTDGLLLALSMT